jgi:hypothetical protein
MTRQGNLADYFDYIQVYSKTEKLTKTGNSVVLGNISKALEGLVIGLVVLQQIMSLLSTFLFPLGAVFLFTCRQNR